MTTTNTSLIKQVDDDKLHSLQSATLSLSAPHTAEDYCFPFPPYNIQLDFMQSLYTAIETGKVGIFESPTGTGKSLSLLCGALRWIQDNNTRNEQQYEAQLRQSLETTNNEDQWKKEQTILRETREAKRIASQQARSKARYIKHSRESTDNSLRSKRQKLDIDETLVEITKSESTFLLDEINDGSNSTQSIVNKNNQSNDTTYLTDQAHEEILPPIKQLSQDVSTGVTKIFYCSRTHSQLSQFVQELRKTSYAHKVQCISLGSRQSLCINPAVRSLGSVTRMNDRCLELRSKGAKQQCSYYGTTQNDVYQSFTNHLHDTIHDIEELTLLGKELGVCPYYGIRQSLPECQLITLPYQLLLQPSARQSLGISLEGHVVIVDEAHNLVDTLTQIHTVTLTHLQIEATQRHLSTYLTRYKDRLSSSNATRVRELLVVINALISFTRRYQHTSSKKVDNKLEHPPTQESNCYTANDFLHLLNVDDINMLELQKFIQQSHIARKLYGFTEHLKAQSTRSNTTKDNNDKSAIECNNDKDLLNKRIESQPAIYSTSWMHQIETFLVSLINADTDGRVLVRKTNNNNNSNNSRPIEVVELKYLLLDPSKSFRSVVEEARAVILAGGTMSPIDGLIDRLFPYLSVEQRVHFGCGHVVPPESLLALVVGHGPTGHSFELTYTHRQDHVQMDGLGQALISLCQVIPDGVVCFFPSYSYMEAIYRYWNQTNVLSRLSKRKRIFLEPRQADKVDTLWTAYTAAINTDMEHYGGAVLFCVVGGKMSEGINFSDRLGRGVIMFGLPFPNLTSPELQEQLRFINGIENETGQAIRLNSKGMKHYESICMRAVNQSIGRAIRHFNDYATIALLDHRYYSNDRIRQSLPTWIQDRLVNCQRFGEAVGNTAQFFRHHSKRL
ncbi:helicase C-terminal domain-containing protein [Syncephalis fuscata]|nr:helicase C-terminal domain-containing protein [Syncephalis fuscata]